MDHLRWSFGHSGARQVLGHLWQKRRLVLGLTAVVLACLWEDWAAEGAEALGLLAPGQADVARERKDLTQ